jgi:hypothetical protein
MGIFPFKELVERRLILSARIGDQGVTRDWGAKFTEETGLDWAGVTAK